MDGYSARVLFNSNPLRLLACWPTTIRSRQTPPDGDYYPDHTLDPPPGPSRRTTASHAYGGSLAASDACCPTHRPGASTALGPATYPDSALKRRSRICYGVCSWSSPLRTAACARSGMPSLVGPKIYSLLKFYVVNVWAPGHFA
jgi:hypothetical protein